MATLDDVARLSQVSAMTVSRVINNKGAVSEATQRRVMDAINQLNYRPNLVARGLATCRTNSIGVVVVIGMSIATLLGVFFIPCSFVFIMKLFRSRITAGHHGEDPDEVAAYAMLEAQEKES